jgi:hypothetical protein
MSASLPLDNLDQVYTNVLATWTDFEMRATSDKKDLLIVEAGFTVESSGTMN